MVTRRISEFADKTVDPEVQTADFLGDGTHLKAATETLEAVVAIEGDWKFHEITASTGPILSTRRNTVALNTTDDHGWIVVDSDGSDGCVVHAAEVQVGDYVLVFPEGSFSPVVAQVTYTRSFRLPVKYAAYTDSGLLVANGMLTTVFCDHDSNDCAANLTLKERLDVWKQRHAKQMEDAEEMFPAPSDGRVTPERELPEASLREEIDELNKKVNKMQSTLKRFKRKVAAQLDN
jgi:cell division protein ZapA (FtsZ GTPase activity inhibitor)